MSPAFKWAWEFDQKKEGAKPVTFNELCGVYNPRNSPFGEMDQKTENLKVETTAFGGIPCACRKSDS